MVPELCLFLELGNLGKFHFLVSGPLAFILVGRRKAKKKTKNIENVSLSDQREAPEVPRKFPL